jgi:hypothetical protein
MYDFMQKLSQKRTPKNSRKIMQGHSELSQDSENIPTNIQVFHLKIKIIVISGETESQKKSIVKQNVASLRL